MGLVGKFFFYMGEEYSYTGEIVAQISDDLLLVLFGNCGDCPATKRIISVKQLMTDIDSDRVVEIFDTRDELEHFEAWLDTPPEDKAEVKAAAVN